MKNWPHIFAKLLTPEEAFRLKVQEGVTLEEYRERAMDDSVCEVCGRPSWRIVGLGMCFTCVTGESDASDDYELVLIRNKNKIKPMKKLIASLVLVLALLVTVSTSKAHAQVVDPTATSTPVYGMGGWSTPCFYLRQIHEDQKGYTCDDAKYDFSRFALDSGYREAYFVGPWRQYIFVEVAGRQAR